MEDKILRLMPKEKPTRIELLDIETKSDLFIDIVREEYTEDLKGYFLRSKSGTVLIINNTLSPADQAQVIKVLQKGLTRCSASEMGLVGKDMNFRCGGFCCF